MASFQPRDKDSAPKTSGQASARNRNDPQNTTRRSHSLNAKGAAGKTAAGTSRPTYNLQSGHGTSANKDMSAGKHTSFNSTFRSPAMMPSQAKPLNGVKEQQNARHQPDMMLRGPEVVFAHIDITELKADVIVCPVGPILDTTKGISRIVMEKAGSGLRSAFAAKRREGTLPIGHTFVTGSFNLRNCAHVIHVVVPKMTDNKNLDTCIRDLGKAFDNCFEELKTVKTRGPGGMGRVETLAMPALGAGTNRIPRKIVAVVMCDSVHKFLRQGGSLAPHLRKIFLVSLDDLMLISLREEWDVAVQPRGSRDAKSDYNSGGRSGSQMDPFGAGPHSHGRGGPTMQASTWYDEPNYSNKGDGGNRIEAAGAIRAGGTYNVHQHSYDRGYPSVPASILHDKDDRCSGEKQGALVARGVTVSDRGGNNYPLSGRMDQPKQRDWSGSKNVGTSHDADSDSDSAQGAWGGAYGPQNPKAYQPYNQMDRPRGGDLIWVTPGQASSSSDGRNKASGIDYTFRSGTARDLPSHEVGYNSKTNRRGGQHRSSDSSDEFLYGNSKVNVDRTKSLTATKDDESCPICFDPIVGRNSESLPMCGHKVCKDCWKELKLRDPICPVCRKVYGELRGSQPINARMTVQTDQHIRLPGYERFGAIIIDYAVPNGRQTEEHPNPGKPYKGTQRRAYLPNNTEGKEVLRLLDKAFKARLTFTVGRSVTSGTDDVVTWNDIHHKTNISGKEFGYPDPTYLTRVKEELAAKGIK